MDPKLSSKSLVMFLLEETKKNEKVIPQFGETSIFQEENTMVGHAFFWIQNDSERKQMLPVQALQESRQSPPGFTECAESGGGYCLELG